MKRKNLILIGTLTFAALMFFNVQFLFQVDGSKTGAIKLDQDEAYAQTKKWEMEYPSWGCRCIPGSTSCFISVQCVCRLTPSCICCPQQQ